MTWLIQRNPLAGVRHLNDELNRFFDASFPRSVNAEESLFQGNWNPGVDLYENENAINLEVDLPGLEPGDFELSIENFTLTLKGERKFSKKEHSDNYHRVERTYGRFARTFSLPSTIDVEAVRAEFKNGVLKVSLPKREEVKPRQIQIAVKSDNGSQAKSADVK